MFCSNVVIVILLVVAVLANHSTRYLSISISDSFFFLFFIHCSYRDLALVNIMLLAGMGIELKALVQKLWPVLRLSILPTLGEVLVVAVIAKYVLKMPFLWSFLLG